MLFSDILQLVPEFFFLFKYDMGGLMVLENDILYSYKGGSSPALPIPLSYESENLRNFRIFKYEPFWTLFLITDWIYRTHNKNLSQVLLS